MRNVIEIKAETKQVWIGEAGQTYENEADAVLSIIKARLSELLSAASASYDYDTDRGAQALIDNADDVIQWLKAHAAVAKGAA